jgi:preprotein translocase subunit YajC
MESLGGLLFPLLILLLFIPIFLSGRKQRRQMQTMQQLQSSLETGDVVTTTSGLRGTVVDASYEETVDLEIADGVVTTWLRQAVRDKVLDAGADSTAAVAVDDADLDDAPAVTGTHTDAAASDGRPTETLPTESLPTETVHTETGSPAEPRSDANGSHRP